MSTCKASMLQAGFIQLPHFPLPVPAIEVLDVAGIARAGVGCCAVAIDAAILTHWHANLSVLREASVAYTRVICCKRCVLDDSIFSI